MNDKVADALESAGYIQTSIYVKNVAKLWNTLDTRRVITKEELPNFVKVTR